MFLHLQINVVLTPHIHSFEGYLLSSLYSNTVFPTFISYPFHLLSKSSQCSYSIILMTKLLIHNCPINYFSEWSLKQHTSDPHDLPFLCDGWLASSVPQVFTCTNAFPRVLTALSTSVLNPFMVSEEIIYEKETDSWSITSSPTFKFHMGSWSVLSPLRS